MNSDNKGVINVVTPPLDPQETERIFRELHNRHQWRIYGVSEIFMPVVKASK